MKVMIPSKKEIKYCIGIYSFEVFFMVQFFPENFRDNITKAAWESHAAVCIRKS